MDDSNCLRGEWVHAERLVDGVATNAAPVSLVVGGAVPSSCFLSYMPDVSEGEYCEGVAGVTHEWMTDLAESVVQCGCSAAQINFGQVVEPVLNCFPEKLAVEAFSL